HLAPGLAAVRRSEDTALRLRTVSMTQRAGQNDIRITRVDQHAADSPGLLETHQVPGFAGVTGLVDPGAHRNMAADEGLPGPCPNRVGIARRVAQRPTGC